MCRYDLRAIRGQTRACQRPPHYGCLRGVVGRSRIRRTFAALQTVKGRGRESRALLAIEGFAYLRASRLEDARRHWDEYWRRANSDRDFAAQRHATRPFFDPQNQANFPARTPVKAAAASERICVYTALFDGYDELRPPAYKPPGVDFICFSDKPLAAAGWEVRQIELPGSSAAMKNRRLKFSPTRFSPTTIARFIWTRISSCWATSRGCTRIGCAGNLSSPGAIRSAAPCSMNCTCCSRPQKPTHPGSSINLCSSPSRAFRTMCR